MHTLRQPLYWSDRKGHYALLDKANPFTGSAIICAAPFPAASLTISAALLTLASLFRLTWTCTRARRNLLLAAENAE